MAKACSKYLPGTMDKRVSIQSVTQTTDGQGGYTETWATDVTVWAYIKPMKAYERMQAQKLETPLSHKVTIRYRSGVTTKHRLLFGSRVFHIKGIINPDEANQFLELTCIEIEEA